MNPLQTVISSSSSSPSSSSSSSSNYQQQQGYQPSNNSNGDSSVSLLQQVIHERNLLKSQNDQLWKLIEKQKVTIKNLQLDNQKLISVRDKLVTKLKNIDILKVGSLEAPDDVTLSVPINKNGNENFDNSNNNNNNININSSNIADNQIESTVSIQYDNHQNLNNNNNNNNDNNNNDDDDDNNSREITSNQIHPQSQQAQSQQVQSKQSQNVKQNDNDSQQHRYPQSNSSIQILPPHQPIHNDSISSILSSSFTNSGTSVNALAGNYPDLESPNTSNATVKDDNNNNNSKTLNDEHDSLILNTPNVNNNQKLDVSLNDNTISTTSMSTGNKSSSPSPIIPPKSSQRQSSIRISNNSTLNSPSQKPDNFNNDNNHEFQNDNNFSHSPHHRPLSPSNSIMSVNSAKSYHNNVNAQSINVESDINDPDPLGQFPQPTHRDPLVLTALTSPNSLNSNISNNNNDNYKENLDENESSVSSSPTSSVISSSSFTKNNNSLNVPESLGLLANRNQLTPPHSPGLPSSPKAFLHNNSSNSSINSMNNDNPNPSHQNIHQMKQPSVKSQSVQHLNLPNKNNKNNDGNNYNNENENDADVGDETENSSKYSRIHSDSNKNNRALKTSKSFDRYESNNPRLLNKNSNGSLYIPPRNQENSNNVVISPPSNKNSTESSSSPERVMRHIKKASLPDVNIITNQSSFYQQQQQQQQQNQRQQHQYQQYHQQQNNVPPSSETSLLLGDSISGITVKVIGSNKKINDKGKEVLAFVIVVGKSKVVDAVVVGMEKELWRIEKLYSDFLGLDSKLKQKQLKSAANKIGKLPDKTLFHNNSPSKADQRKLALEHYLLHAISLNLNDSKDLYEFLSSNVVEPDDKDNQLRGRKEGYLTKKGKSFGGWKTRYFVLDGPLLEYYESKDGSQLGFIRITNAQIGRQSNVNNDSDKDNENSYRHAFLILESKPNSKNAQTRHVLCAESDSDRDEWIEMLLQYVGVSEEEAKEKTKKRKDVKSRFMKESISKIDAQPISQLDRNEQTDKLIATDVVLQQAQKDLQSKNNNNSSSNVNNNSNDSKLQQLHHQQFQQNQQHHHHHPNSSFNNDQIDSSKNIQSNQQQQHSHLQPNFQPPPPPPTQPPSMLGNNTGHNLISPRDGSEKIKGSTLEPKDPLPLGNGTTHLHKQLSLRKDRHNDEHKKAARKTFFGSMFGSKDDKKKYQDPRPDSNKIVFGVPLDQAIAVSRIKENYELPAVVYRCIEYLDAKNAAEEEGIYRLSGATATIKRLKERFNTEGDVDLLSEEEYYDVHAVAGLLKLYLRELPTSVLSRDLHLEFVNVIDLLGRKDRINELGRLVSALPLSNYTLLRTLTGHLIRIVQNAQINKMTARNIGIVFSPTLGLPASVFSLFMAEFDYIFFTNSDGVAAPRTMDASPEEPGVSKNSPVALLPVTAVRRIDIRDEPTGRNNRNSVHYMDSAPEKVVGLEKRMTVTKPIRQNDDTSDEEDVNDLAIQAEQEEEDDDEYDGSSIDETTTQSVPTSPRLHTTQLPTMNSVPTSSDLTKSNDTIDSMPGVFSEHQKQDYENENISLPTVNQPMNNNNNKNK